MFMGCPRSRYAQGSDNSEADLTQIDQNDSCPQVREAVEWEKEHVCGLAAGLIAGWLLLSEGRCMEKRGARRDRWAVFVFDTKDHQGWRLRSREDRGPSQLLMGLCSFY